MSEPAPTERSSIIPPTPKSGSLPPTQQELTADYELTTGGAPSLPPGPVDLSPLTPGARLDDFEIISLLGQGGFACVYLARQISLDRQVALKVSANRGTEARTLASLEHEHIVRVFAEAVDLQANRRLLCMQYVNGATLEQVLGALAHRSQRSGRAIIEALDELSKQPALFDPAALRDRELLWQADYVEAVAWLGARLAEALAHAHSQGVLHRDIKPANVLLNRYGRPMLADFNIAFDPRPVARAARQQFGGTLGYMAPEHLDAFNPDTNTSPEIVDRRSDIYSLGVVLFEMVIGWLPFPLPTGARVTTELLHSLAAERRARAPGWGDQTGGPLEPVIRRCLQPRPEDRYQTADELARALDGCREQRQAERHMPPAGPITRALFARPFVVGLVLLLLPHLIGSIVNIWHNSLRIVNQLSEPQQAAFARLVLLYNGVIYPVALVALVVLVTPVWRGWRQLQHGSPVDPAEVTASRARLLALPGWAMALSAAGWLPGGLVFPLGLWLLTGACEAAVFGQFVLSFTISGLIALTYAVFATQYFVVRVLYPRWRLDAREFHKLAREELRPVNGRLGWLQLLAGLIPLTGAILMVGVGPSEFASGYQGFRVLVTLLIGLGMLGFGVAVSLRSKLGETVAALTGGSSTPAQ